MLGYCGRKNTPLKIFKKNLFCEIEYVIKMKKIFALDKKKTL